MRNVFYFFALGLLLNCAITGNHGEIVLLDKGLKYRFLNIKRAEYKVKQPFKLFYVQLDPQLYSIELLLANDFSHKSLAIKEYSKLSKAFLTINASFYDKKIRPIGLQIQKGKVIKNLRQIEGGVFYLKDQMPNIVHTKQFLYDSGISFAIQSRPRLVYKGKLVPLLKKQIAKRSFIGITKDKQVIIGVTENSKAFANDLAKILALGVSSGGVGCQHALNLDGGSSSQFYINYKEFQKTIPGDRPVPNALAVFKRNNK